ncbi:MAG TPA: pyruvate kinase [Cyanobacteria bacterium UBA11149]|nr:pyruvate kinase [Cyanobacteria bacterium UBA11367]HBE56237.1 pyruvate kinase [Cyanobacteria bacterium UBA11366]HBK64650.1 pyruvate kinase [Cyanobacteria bacterium UBA11166]HBR76214.1 pyruvate kinase [Cyanobacteria bacterium UBA11159]HBS69965.1 pyruvate kinase [Cyanobacteria bacterium UBA11153]HBW89324.1 pyruvate kinase [Cyanobacteria bacterium UBA11149]HCA94232.1 pyruvate kinase [Cyanobacteria bacterium UBA9226]
MRRTKIICTIGPATAARENLETLVEAGMNVARLNFSHGSHEFHGKTIQNLREISYAHNKPLALLQDLCGPKIRLGTLPTEGIEVKAGEEITFVLQEEGNNINEIPLPIPTLFAMVRVGEPISINDGRVKLIVTGRDADSIRALVKIGGLLSTHKGVNLPETYLPVTSVTEKDLMDLRFGLQSGVDFVAVSFVRSAQDLEPVKRMIEAAGAKTRVIAKIEKREAVESFEDILNVADGIMIARGDLGVEMPLDEVPMIQKQIIRRCNQAGKPVITATQMLESMISAPDPTRAEVTDVANSILDGTDAVMLSGETAVGQYPIAAVEMMHNIALRTEASLQEGFQKVVISSEVDASITDSVAEAACRIASKLVARGIMCNSSSGGAARLISKYRPKTPIIAFTPEKTTYHQLAISWGVQPYLIPAVKTAEEMLTNVINAALEMELAEYGDKVVITSGVPIGKSGTTSLIKVHTIGQPITA